MLRLAGMEPSPTQCYAAGSNLRRGVHERGGKGYGPRTGVRIGDRSLLRGTGDRASTQPHHRQRPLVRCGGHRGVELDMDTPMAAETAVTATGTTCELDRGSLMPSVGPVCGDAVYFDLMANSLLPVERALPEAGRLRRRHLGVGGGSACVGGLAAPAFQGRRDAGVADAARVVPR